VGARRLDRLRNSAPVRLDPQGNIIHGVLGLGISGGFTILDFNRLRRARAQDAVPIAASIFLDIFYVFLVLLDLFGGERP
jgi:FtsH-binding integral membrane protein